MEEVTVTNKYEFWKPKVWKEKYRITDIFLLTKKEREDKEKLNFYVGLALFLSLFFLQLNIN